MKKMCSLLCVLICIGTAGAEESIYKKGWIDFNKNGVKDVYDDPNAPVEVRVKNLLGQMTLEQKS